MKCAATDLTIWDFYQVEHGAGNIHTMETGIDSFSLNLYSEPSVTYLVVNRGKIRTQGWKYISVYFLP